MKTCKICKKEFVQYNTIQNKCTDCAIKIGISKPKKLNYQKIKKEKLEALQTKKQTYVKKVNAHKLIFQKWIRTRDKNNSCISCNCIVASGFDAGHYYKAENYSGLIFDERNCHKQCEKCNRMLQGNNLEYGNNLRLKFGIEFMEKLRLDAYLTKVKTWSDEELQQIKEKYKL